MTLDRLIFERAGIVQSALVARHLADWIGAAHRLGHFPTTVEFAEVMGVTERSGWRSRARVRRHFTDAEFRSVVLQAVEQGDAEFRAIEINLQPSRSSASVRASGGALA